MKAYRLIKSGFCYLLLGLLNFLKFEKEEIIRA